MFREIDPKALPDNLIRVIAEEWMLITAGDETALNTMTASWGFAGEVWGKDAVVALIRPQRYTLEFVEKKDYFTLSFYGDNKAIHKVCGSQSGRDIDKVAATGLTPVFDKAPYFEQARLVLICKKQYVQRMEPSCFTEEGLDAAFYPNGDYHYLVIGRIEKALIREENE